MILDFISFVAIFINAGLIASTTETFEGDDRITVFVLLIIILLGMKYITRTAVADIPDEVVITSKRHNYVKETIKKGYKSSPLSKLKSARVKLSIIEIPEKMPDATVLNFNKNEEYPQNQNDFSTLRKINEDQKDKGEIKPAIAGFDEIPLMGVEESKINNPKGILLRKIC